MVIKTGSIFPATLSIGTGPKFRLPVTVGLILLILVALPIATFINIGLNKAQKDAMDHLVNDSGTSVLHLETNIQTHLDSVKVQSERLARLLANNEEALYEPKKFERLISGALSGLPQVREIGFINPRGMVYRVKQNSYRLKVSNWSDDPAVQRLLSDARVSLKPKWANFFFAESTKRSFMNFHQPLLVKGHFAGVCFA